MQTLNIVKGTMMAASISLLLLAAKMANAEELMSNKIPTLKQTITRGEVVTYEMLATQEYAGASVPAFIVKDPGNVIGMEAVRNIRAGMPLYRSQFREVPAVRKGEMATVIFQKGKIRLTTDGLVMADASVGDFVKILNQDSKQMLHGVVKKHGLVLVN